MAVADAGCPLAVTRAAEAGCAGNFWRSQLGRQSTNSSVRSGRSALDVVRSDDWAAVRAFARPADPDGEMSCGSHAARNSTRAIEALASTHGAVALAVDVCQGFHPSVYGHVFATVYAFYCWLVRPLRHHVKNGDVVRLYLPAGAHLGRRGSAILEEVEGLFSHADARLRISRAAWVPYCQYGCCLANGRVPPALRGRVAIVHGFPNHDHEAAELPPRARATFSRDVRRFLLPAASAAGTVDGGAANGGAADGGAADGGRADRGGGQRAEDGGVVVTWLLAARGSNGRRIAHEASLVASFREHLQQRHPGWELAAVHTDGYTDGHALSYREEARAIARSDVLISLFGSALHGCRFLPRGALVLEIHGALRHESVQHWNYYNTCGWLYGMRWLGLPLAAMGEESTAHVDAAAFTAFFERAVRGEYEALLNEYTDNLRAHPDPDRRSAAARGEWARARTMRDKNGHSWDAPGGATLARLPAQYAHRHVRLSKGERERLEATPLGAGHVYASASDELPPRADAWLVRLARERTQSQKDGRARRERDWPRDRVSNKLHHTYLCSHFIHPRARSRSARGSRRTG